MGVDGYIKSYSGALKRVAAWYGAGAGAMPSPGSLDPFPQGTRHALQNRGKIVLTEMNVQDAEAFPVVTGGGQGFF